MEWIRIVLVVALIGRAIYTDLKKGIIENRILGIGLLLGLICAYVEGGTGLLFRSIGMTFLMLAGLWFLFVLKGLGGGDIKLLCVLATFYPEHIVMVVVVSFVAGAGIGLLRMLFRLLQKQQAYRKGETIHFSVAVGIGMAYLLMFGG